MVYFLLLPLVKEVTRFVCKMSPVMGKYACCLEAYQAIMIKKAFKIISILILTAFVTACGEEGEPVVATPTVMPTETVASAAPVMETITVFTFDPNSMTIMPSQVRKNKDDDSLMYITELVLNNLEDDDIQISEVQQEDDKAIIVFDSSSKPVKNCTAEVESLILECFANSILDNVDGCHGVIFRTNKGAYKSKNIKMGEDEVYASR